MRTRRAAIGLTLTPNASVVAGRSDSRPIIKAEFRFKLWLGMRSARIGAKGRRRSIQAEFPAAS